MERRIGLKVGQIVNYMGKKCEVERVFPYIAYLKDLNTLEVMCCGMGDLVIGGVEPCGRGAIPSPLLSAKETVRQLKASKQEDY